MYSCVAPICYLILELLIRIHYDYLFLLSEIYCSWSIHYVKVSKMTRWTPLLGGRALKLKRKTKLDKSKPKWALWYHLTLFYWELRIYQARFSNGSLSMFNEVRSIPHRCRHAVRRCQNIPHTPSSKGCAARIQLVLWKGGWPEVACPSYLHRTPHLNAETIQK